MKVFTFLLSVVALSNGFLFCHNDGNESEFFKVLEQVKYLQPPTCDNMANLNNAISFTTRHQLKGLNVQKTMGKERIDSCTPAIIYCDVENLLGITIRVTGLHRNNLFSITSRHTDTENSPPVDMVRFMVTYAMYDVKPAHCPLLQDSFSAYSHKKISQWNSEHSPFDIHLVEEQKPDGHFVLDMLLKDKSGIHYFAFVHDKHIFKGTAKVQEKGTSKSFTLSTTGAMETKKDATAPLFEADFHVYIPQDAELFTDIEKLLLSIQGATKTISVEDCQCAADTSTTHNCLSKDFLEQKKPLIKDGSGSLEGLVTFNFKSVPLIIDSTAVIKDIDGYQIITINQTGIAKNWDLINYSLNQTLNISSTGHGWEEMTYHSDWIQIDVEAEWGNTTDIFHTKYADFNLKKGPIPRFEIELNSDDTDINIKLMFPELNNGFTVFWNIINFSDYRLSVNKLEGGITTLLADIHMHVVGFDAEGKSFNINIKPKVIDYLAFLSYLKNFLDSIIQAYWELMDNYQPEVEDIVTLFVSDWKCNRESLWGFNCPEYYKNMSVSFESIVQKFEEIYDKFSCSPFLHTMFHYCDQDYAYSLSIPLEIGKIMGL